MVEECADASLCLKSPRPPQSIPEGTGWKLKDVEDLEGRRQRSPGHRDPGEETEAERE